MKLLLIFLHVFLAGLALPHRLLAADCDQSKRLIEQGSKEKKLKSRLALYQQAVEHCPDADAPHFYYGLALEETEDGRGDHADYTVAESEYRKALFINPRHTGAIFKLAGIAYITHRFDSAKAYYSQFLALEKPCETNYGLIQSANHLLAKSKWLACLPAGSLDKGALTNDPDRLAGISNLLGSMAMELGNAAMQVTGQVGYGLVGAGLKIGLSLATNSTINTAPIRRNYESGRYDVALWEATSLLPKAVNKKGINSEDVFALLVYINRCATQMPGLLNQAAPYCGGVLAMYPVFLQINVQGTWSGQYIYSNLTDFTSAWERLGDYSLQQNRYGEAIRHYRAARDLQRQFGGVHKKGARIPNAEEPETKRQEFLLDIAVANAECFADSTHARALQTLEKAFDQLQQEAGWREQPALWGNYLKALETWGIFSGSHPSCGIDDFLRYKALVGRYPVDKSSDAFLIGLNNCLSVLLHSWGEYSTALQHLSPKPVEVKGAPAPDILLDYRRAVLYNSVFMLDSTRAVLQNMRPNVLRYKEQISLSRRLLMTGEIAEAMNLLVACRDLEKQDAEIRNADLMPATTLLWVVLEAQTTEANTILEQLLAHWKMVGDQSAGRLPALAASLLRLTAFSEGYSGPKKQLYDHLDAVCRQTMEHRTEDLNILRLQYFIAAHQWERALELCLQMEKLESVAPPNPRSFAALQQSGKALAAMLFHQTKRYKEAVEYRRAILEHLLPFEQELPENVADCKVRLAESLAAVGQKAEAYRLLEEAVACFDRLSPVCQTLYHQRARHAFRLLTEGQTDIVYQSNLTFECAR